MSVILGWIGVCFGICVSIPQVISNFKNKSTRGVSKLTYIFLLVTVCCYEIRAIAIWEPIFIVSNLCNIFIVSTVLVQMKIYGGSR